MTSQNRRPTMKDKHTKYPQLRFKGFTDPWEQRKLGEVFNYEQPTKYIVKSTEYDDDFETPVLTAGKSFVLGYTNENTGIKKATVEDPIVIFDDFTTSSHYVDFPFKIKSSAMKLLSLNDDANDFYFMFNTLKKIKYVPQSHERHWISRFSEFEIYKPTLAEQKKIGSFFHQLDDTITLHQRKLAKLKKLKQGYLQKMFPKNGSKFPQLRFAGFSDAWEQRKLSTSLSFLKDGTHGSHPDGDYAYLLSTKNLQNGRVVIDPITDRKIDQINYESIFRGYEMKDDDVLMSVVGRIGSVARFKLNPGTRVAFQRSVAILRGKPNLTQNFLFHLLQIESNQKQFRRLTTKSAQPDLFLGDLSEAQITFPIVDEQNKISNLIANLDYTIALHQRKLEKLQELKKGYLQKMFC